MLANAGLTILKLVAGIVGHSYALIADAIESLADIVGSAVIWGGLRVSSMPASAQHPYGYGKAEALAGLVVSGIIFAAGIGISIEAVHEIITPHHAPAPFTLIVLIVVVIVKEILFRVVRGAAAETSSNAVHTDAFHHRADALTSIAAFVGISIALIGGKGWEPADDWAALAAAAVIMFNAVSLMIQPLRELLDVQSPLVGDEARVIASAVPGVRRVEKLVTRKSGMGVWVDMHVWVDQDMRVKDAHSLAHCIKDAVRAKLPSVRDVLIHVEPAPEAGNLEAGGAKTLQEPAA